MHGPLNVKKLFFIFMLLFRVYGYRNCGFCWVHCPSLGCKCMSMERWWNVEREKPKYFDRNLSFCHFSVHRSYVKCPGGRTHVQIPAVRN